MAMLEGLWEFLSGAQREERNWRLTRLVLLRRGVGVKGLMLQDVRCRSGQPGGVVLEQTEGCVAGAAKQPPNAFRRPMIVVNGEVCHLSMANAGLGLATDGT